MQNDCFPNAPADWARQSIGGLAFINPRYPVSKEADLPFIEMAAVAEEFGGIQSWGYRRLEGSGLSRFKVGDTIFAKITPCPENGKIAFVRELPAQFGIGSTEFIVLSPRVNCHPLYLFYLLCADEVRSRATARMEGSTGRQRVPDDVFEKRLIVPRPSLPEQEAIVSLLACLDDVIQKSKTKLERARALKTALSQRLFTFGLRNKQSKKSLVGRVPSSWSVVEVKSLVTEFQYGLSVAMQESGDMPILRMGNIQDGNIILSGLKHVNLPDKITSPYIVRKGDVLFNRTNSQELVGKIGIYRSDQQCVFASYLIRIKPDVEKVDNYFLGQILSTHDAQCRIKRYATPGVQQVNVNATNLGKVLIPVPVGKGGLEEQREIANILEQADASIRLIQPKLAALSKLKGALSTSLFMGETRATKLADELVGVAA